MHHIQNLLHLIESNKLNLVRRLVIVLVQIREKENRRNIEPGEVITVRKVGQPPFGMRIGERVFIWEILADFIA